MKGEQRKTERMETRTVRSVDGRDMDRLGKTERGHSVKSAPLGAEIRRIADVKGPIEVLGRLSVENMSCMKRNMRELDQMFRIGEMQCEMKGNLSLKVTGGTKKA